MRKEKAAFEYNKGVIDAVPEVCSGKTGHYEAVEVTYDPDKITYRQLLEIFWRQIDPTDAGGQFADRGTQYRTAVFYLDEAQKKVAEESRKEVQECGLFPAPVVTQILPAVKFYPAEEYHQEYYEKQPMRYQLYREGSGRNRFIEQVWEKHTCPIPHPRKTA
ncbi:MAG: peptide-methionine (S)-S-oxide reductase MsrA [Deltaproteobacteria bacterium]